MRSLRRGIALPAAIVAIAALSAVAALATIAARVAVLEAAAIRDDARSERTRAVLRARLARVLATTSRAQLLANAPLGGGDTVAALIPLAWPWHRVRVTAGGAEIVGELARVRAPSLPWCAPLVGGDIGGVPASAVSPDPAFDCDDDRLEIPPDSVGAFVDSLVASLVLPPLEDTVLLVAEPGDPRVAVARHVVELAAGVEYRGLVIAREVRVGAGARLRGGVLAIEVAVAGAGGAIIGDRMIVSGAIARASRLTLLGRRGLLRSP